MQIKKRNGETVPFDESKIQIAISKAYVDVNYKANDALTNEIAADVIAEIQQVFRWLTPLPLLRRG